MRTRCLCWLLAVSLPCAALAQDTTAPTAVADGPGVVPYGGVVYLSGDRSTDPGGSIATYTWVRIEGQGGEMPLNQPRASTLAGFELAQYPGDPLRPGRHRFRLQVTDAAGHVSQPAEVVVIVVDNVPPVAILGAHATVAFGAPLVLHGEHSADIAGRVVQWRFSRVQGQDGLVMPINQVFSTGQGSFSVQQYPPSNQLAPGAHVFRLVVVDDSGNQSSPRDVTVNVVGTADTSAPTAVLDAPNTVGFSTPLSLSATRSADAGGQLRRFEWMRLSGAGGAGMPVNQSFITESATFVVPQPAGSALAPGRHRFRLTVQDDSGNVSQPVEREVIVVDNVAPTALLDVVPGPLLPGEAFTLSGKRSTDGGGRIVKYVFTRIAGSREGPMPLNVPLELESYVLSVPDSRANPYALGRQVFRLTVMDDSGNVSKPADVAVDVVAKR